MWALVVVFQAIRKRPQPRESVPLRFPPKPRGDCKAMTRKGGLLGAMGLIHITQQPLIGASRPGLKHPLMAP
jgi:hypothetical protein